MVNSIPANRYSAINFLYLINVIALRLVSSVPSPPANMKPEKPGSYTESELLS